MSHSEYEPIPPLQPHLTGLTNFGGDRTFGPQENMPQGPGPNISDNPTVLVQTLLNEFWMFQHNVEMRLNNLEQNIQGSLFTNQHFNDLRTDLVDILNQTQLRQQPTGTNHPVPPPAPTPAPAPASAPAPMPASATHTMWIKLAKPEKFDGKKDNSTLFKVSLTQYLRATYPGSLDNKKIAFIISYLDSKASEWIEPHLEFDVLHRPVNWLHNVNLFWAEFEKRFVKIDCAAKALKKLKTLRQKQSVQDYVTEFQTLATHVNYDNLALRNMFYEGLKDKIKMAMLSQMFNVKDDNTSGQMVVNRALLIDQHLEQFAG
ncbi:Transposon Tf2-12 polyprotein [Ceratobasidium sp. AG-Ba]|nr:Transposon Tf2-12 polyprotein [Ceratobasidium sp. AG-Ba]